MSVPHPSAASREPSLTIEPYAVEVPYSNTHLLTSGPLGLTVALRIAAVFVTDEAPVVSTTAGLGGVLNIASSPLLVPNEFVAEILVSENPSPPAVATCGGRREEGSREDRRADQSRGGLSGQSLALGQVLRAAGALLPDEPRPGVSESRQ